MKILEPARALVRAFDRFLSRCYGIHPFSNDPDCLLRLGLARARKQVVLKDGTTVRPGDLVGDLHLWNDRIPSMPPAGANLAWGLGFQRRLRRSLELLAERVEAERGEAEAGAGQAAGPGGCATQGLGKIRAFRAVGSLMSRDDAGGSGAVPGGTGRGGAGPSGAEVLITAVPALAERLGMEIAEVEDPARSGLWRRFAAFWENGYNQTLVWAYNPPSLKSRRVSGLRRVQLWISREALVARYRRGAAT